MIYYFRLKKDSSVKDLKFKKVYCKIVYWINNQMIYQNQTHKITKLLKLLESYLYMSDLIMDSYDCIIRQRESGDKAL